MLKDKTDNGGLIIDLMIAECTSALQYDRLDEHFNTEQDIDDFLAGLKTDLVILMKNRSTL